MMMKELSIEEKAKRYDELLVKLQEAKVDNNVCDDRYCCVIDDIVPELKENKDEKIREAIYNCVRWFGFGSCFFKYVSQEECFAWLEKQGEQEPAWSEEDEDILNTIINHFKVDIGCTDEDDIVRLLKFLKYKYTWKPSDEQIWCLSDAVKHYNSLGFPAPKLKELLDDLKKLKS